MKILNALLLALALIASPAYAADTKISAMSACSTLGGTEVFPLVQSGGNCKQTLSGLQAFDLGNGFTQFTGPTTSAKTFTLPNASSTILTTNSVVTVAQGGTGAATLTGILKGNGTSAFTAATADVDYQGPITLTTTGTSGAATFSGHTLNIPQYSGGGGGFSSPLTTKGDIHVYSTTDARLPVGADGAVLTASSNDALGVNYFQPGLARPGIISGHYYTSLNSTSLTTQSVSSNTMWTTPVYLGQRATFTAIGSWPTAATSVSCHFGVYTSSAGKPAALVSGTDTTLTLTAAAQNDAAFASAVTLNPGWYWITMLCNGSATFNAMNATNTAIFTGTSDMNTSGYKYNKTQSYGALPDPFGTTTDVAPGTLVYMGLKAQ